MRSRIVEEVVRRGPAELAAKARALVARSGNLALQLLELGYPSTAILDGASAATGVRQASASWLREPIPPPVDYDDGLLFRQVGAAPIAVEAGTLYVVYGDPVAASESSSHGLPPHKPYLAMPAQIARALALLPTEPTLAEALPTDPTRRAAFAVRSAAPKGSIDDLEIDDGGDELDAAFDAVAEATRTVPGSAPPQPAGGADASQGDEAAAITAGADIAALRRVAEFSNQSAHNGPASDEDASFEDLRTVQVDLVSPAGRAAVEPTVTATTPSVPPPPPAAKAQPAFRLPTSKATADEDYEDVATVALTRGALEALMAPAAASASAKSPPEGEEFNDPTEHVAALASPAQLAAAKTAPKRPHAALPIADPPPTSAAPASSRATPLPPTPTPLPRKSTPPPRAPKDAPRVASRAAWPSKEPQPPRRGAQATEAELVSTQPMPRYQPSTEMEVVPVPVARRGPSPLASALSTAGKPVMAESAPAARSEQSSEGAGEPVQPEPTPPPARRPSDFGARHIPGFDDALPGHESKRKIPGFAETLDPPAPAPASQRKGRVMMLHPSGEQPVRSTASQETEAEAPAPQALDPDALVPVPLEADALVPADQAIGDETALFDDEGGHDRDFSHPPLPTLAPPAPPAPPPPTPRAPPPLRFDQRPPQQRAPVVEEPDARAQRRGAAGAGGLQVLRAGAAAAPAPPLELVNETPRGPASPPLIPGIDSPMPMYGQEEKRPAPGSDRRSKQIVIGAGVIAMMIIVGAGVARVRSGRGAGGSFVPVVPSPTVIDVPSVPPTPRPQETQVPATQVLPDRPAAVADAGAVDPDVSPNASASRQRELIDEARRLADPAMSIALYSQAIELDPQTTMARDALFERAKLHLATGDRERARADANKLKRRDDTKEIANDVQLILDGAGAVGGGP